MAKKLLFVIDNLNIGGPQKSLLALLDKIDYSLFDVSVVSLHGEGTLSKYYNEKVKFVKPDDLLIAMMLPKNRVVWSLGVFLKRFKIGCFFRSLFSILKCFFFKTNMNQSRQKLWMKYGHKMPTIPGEYDLSFGILGLSTYVVADLVNSKKKYHWVRSDVRILKLNEKIEAIYFNKIDGALSVSNECSDIYTTVYPFMKGKVKTFYNYLPIEFYKRFPSDVSCLDRYNCSKLITISRLSSNKGIEYVIDVAEYLKKHQVAFHWFVLGDGDKRQTYETVVKERNIDDVITFLGFELNTVSFIEKSDIFVHLSESEGKSNAVDEAKYVCKPIVITNYATVKEQIVDSVTGIICDFDVVKIGNAIIDLLSNKGKQEKLIEGCEREKRNTADASQFLLEL